MGLFRVTGHPTGLTGRSEDAELLVDTGATLLDGREVTTPCFMAPGGPPLLWAGALGGLFLAVDPVAKRLIPVEGFVG